MTSIHASTLRPLPIIDQLPDTLFDDEENGEDNSMDWSLNGGEVVFGSAGVAVSPRMLGSVCRHCECKGLGLYVIDEEEEE